MIVELSCLLNASLFVEGANSFPGGKIPPRKIPATSNTDHPGLSETLCRSRYGATSSSILRGSSLVVPRERRHLNMTNSKFTNFGFNFSYLYSQELGSAQKP